jgi:hypothetical protein
MRFVPSASGQLANIQLHISSQAAWEMQISTEASGTPASPLEVLLLPGSQVNGIPIQSFDSLTHPFLQEGTPYWIVLSALTHSVGTVYPKSTGFQDGGRTASRYFWPGNDSGWIFASGPSPGNDAQISFRVTAEVVPESSSWILVSLGIFGVGLCRRPRLT